MYTSESVRRAYSLSDSKLRNDLTRVGVCGPFDGWTFEELVSVWLEHYGERIPATVAGQV